LQLPRPDITVDFDVDQPAAKERRLRVFKELAEDGTPIAATHPPFPGIGILRPDGEGYRLEALRPSREARKRSSEGRKNLPASQ
jgi:hypothetical protein